MKYQSPSIQVIVAHFSSVVCSSFSSPTGFLDDFDLNYVYEEME